MRPRSAIKGFPGRMNGRVDIRDTGFRVISNDRAVRRALAFKSFSGLGRNLLAVDPQLVVKRCFGNHDLVSFELRGAFFAK